MGKKSKFSIATLVGGILLLISLAPIASAQPGEFVKGVLQPLADGFPKHAITFVVVDDPGSRDGILARTMQQALASISPVPILVSDEPVAIGGTFDKLKELLGRGDGTDGYYPVPVNVWGSCTDPLTDDIKGKLGLTLEDMNMVIVTERTPLLADQRKNAPWGKTFADLVKYAKANPGKLKYISSNVGSGTDIACSLVYSLAGILDKVKKIPAQSYTEAATTIAAGGGDIGMTLPETAKIHWEAGRMDITLSTQDFVPPPWDKDPNVVTIEKAGLGKVRVGDFPGWCVPKQTPQSHVDWLFKLFKAGAATPVYMKRETTIPGDKIGIMTPAESNALAKQLNQMAEPIVRSVGLHWDQQKK